MEIAGLLLIQCVFAGLIALLGAKRKIGAGWAFLFSLVLSPIIGLIIVLCSKKIKDSVTFVEEKNENQ